MNQVKMSAEYDQLLGFSEILEHMPMLLMHAAAGPIRQGFSMLRQILCISYPRKLPVAMVRAICVMQFIE